MHLNIIKEILTINFEQSEDYLSYMFYGQGQDNNYWGYF